MITVITAPPYATIQDLGRPGYLASGIPRSGAADTDSAIAVNAIVGNSAGAAVIEWALGAGSLTFGCDAVIALGGAESTATVDGNGIASHVATAVNAGGVLRIERMVCGRFLYIAVRGGIDVPVVLGSRSTLLSAGFGGHQGRRLRSADTLEIGDDVVGADARARAATLLAPRDFGPIPITRGPEAVLFSNAQWERFLRSDFTISRASDRIGYRLEGPVLEHTGAADLPSEPTCIGAIQVPQDGTPIVLMHDGPTVGGYPKIAVIRSRAVSRFAQFMPGDTVRFVLEE